MVRNINNKPINFFVYGEKIKKNLKKNQNFKLTTEDSKPNFNDKSIYIYIYIYKI